jgi:hypothetical protein
MIHLKNNLITHGDKEAGAAKNIRKREVASAQLLTHVRDVIGGDFNINHDQAMFSAEKTLDTLTSATYQSVFEGIPFEQRITHPRSHGFLTQRLTICLVKM